MSAILLYFLEVPADLTLSEGGGRGSLAPGGTHVPWLQAVLPVSLHGQCLSFTCDRAHSPSSALPHRHLLFLVSGDLGGLHWWLHLRTRPPGSTVGLQARPALPQIGWSAQFQRLSGGILPWAGGRDPFLPGCALLCMIPLTFPNTHLMSDHPRGLPIQ